MTTILAVHGTYSFDSESGTKWFQKGSPFEARLRELIEPESGSLTYQPFIWDGENSETSRRAAAAALLVKMQALEAKGEPYSVIGHSHGGSIIATALMDSAARKSKLEHLKCWLTVGTPFITTTKEWSLFNRLGVLGRSFYVALLTCAMMFFLADNRQNAERFAGAHFFQLIGRGVDGGDTLHPLLSLHALQEQSRALYLQQRHHQMGSRAFSAPVALAMAPQ